MGYHFLLQGIFPNQGSNESPTSPALAGGFFITAPAGTRWKDTKEDSQSSRPGSTQSLHSPAVRLWASCFKDLSLICEMRTPLTPGRVGVNLRGGDTGGGPSVCLEHGSSPPMPTSSPDSTAPFHRLLVCPFLPPCLLPPSLCLSKPSQHPGHPPSRASMQPPLSGHPPNPTEMLPWPHPGFYGSFLDLGIRWHIWEHGVCGSDMCSVMCTCTEHFCVCVGV